MKVTIRRGDVLPILVRAAKVADNKATIPVLRHALLEVKGSRLRVSATDLDVALRGACVAQAVLDGDGTALVDAGNLAAILKTLPDGEDIALRVKDDSLDIRCASAKFTLPTLAADDFPELPTTKGASPGARIPGPVLAKLIGRVAFAITSEDARYYLAGAQLIVEPGRATLVATDGHRLAWASESEDITGEAIEALVPRKALSELGALVGDDSVLVQQTDNHVLFTVGDQGLAARRIEGKFPAWEAVVSKRGKVDIELPTGALRAALKRVALFAMGANRPAEFKLVSGALVIRTQDAASRAGEDRIAVDYDGAELAVGFNVKYVAEFVDATDAEAVVLNLSTGLGQGTLTPKGDPGYVYVVMPVRL